jgi:translocation and assembly module TamA
VIEKFVFHIKSLAMTGAMIGAISSMIGSVAHAQSGDGAQKKSAEKAAPETAGVLPNLERGFRERPEAAEYNAVCPTVRIRGEDFDWTAMERRLICGDPAEDQVGTPWTKIPPNQSAYFLKGFMQMRGYHDPTFIQDGEILFVSVGPLSRLSNFTVRGGPESWVAPKRRLIDDRKLTPPLLDELEGWTLGQIRNEGYPCPSARAQANPKTGEVVVDLEPGPLLKIREVRTTGDTGLKEGALDRFNAFLIGDYYRQYLIDLTRSRTVDDGFLQTIVFTAKCEPEGVTILRDVVLGPSRTVRIGFGASTEEGARLRAQVRQARIGSSASSAQARLNVSYLNELVNRQILDAGYTWRYDPGARDRPALEPLLIFEHLSEAQFETRTFDAKLMQSWTREYNRGQAELRIGPTWSTSQRLRGPVGALESSLMYGEIDLRWTEHKYEYYATSPRVGENLEATLLLTQDGVGADFTSQKVRLKGTKLWEVFRYDPPLLILGLRFNVNSVFSHDENLSNRLPLRFLTFIGGDDDIRGFARQSLPGNGVGALSGAAAGFEARLHKVLFRRADPFAFFDSGMLGGVNFALERPVFISPGVGVRWGSPFGVFRGFVAQRSALGDDAETAPYPSEWRLGLTYGEEF